MATQCEQYEKNLDRCGCTYSGCPKKGNCCDCLQFHLLRDELPGCCFPADAEKTYDRSIEHFISVRT